MESVSSKLDRALELLHLYTYDTVGKYEHIRSSNENPNLFYVVLFISWMCNECWLDNLTAKLIGEEFELCEDNIDNPIIDRCLNHIFGTMNIGFNTLHRIIFCGRNLFHCRSMNHVIHILHRLHQAITITYITNKISHTG